MADDLTDRAVPDDWAEVSDPDEIAEKYDPRVPTLFEYAGREIAVHILPDEPNTPHADSTRWRLGFVRGSRDNLKGATPIVHVHGRENASHAAHVFMTTFNEQAELPEQERIDAAKAAASDAVEDA